jgi:nucleoside-diphosphate-sugar epimerase
MKALVTGGGGFLGHRLIELLRERGDDVVFLARGSYPEVEKTGAKGLQIDLRDKDAVAKAAEGCDVVFHVAAKAGYWGSHEEYWGINVDGTQNVIDACKKAGVKRLIYTSTPSVIGYDHDTVNGGPEIPYATKHGSPYPESKAEAERRVLAANSPELATCSLRPHLIFGPRDLNLLPRLIQRSKTGKLPIVGDGTNMVDMTYVDNAAWAHIDAIEALKDHTSPNAGKAYFISNNEPVSVWAWISEFMGKVGVPAPSRKVSLGLANFIGMLMEFVWGTFKLAGEPRMTRFLAAGLARHHWYDMGPAQRDFGYKIRVPMAEATDITAKWYRDHPVA